MSFDVNVLRQKPVIREAANMNNDGGGGNLGYMRQERDKGKNKKQRLDESIFGRKEEDLYVGKSDLEFDEDDFSLIGWFQNILQKLLQVTTSHTTP